VAIAAVAMKEAAMTTYLPDDLVTKILAMYVQTRSFVLPEKLQKLLRTFNMPVDRGNEVFHEWLKSHVLRDTPNCLDDVALWYRALETMNWARALDFTKTMFPERLFRDSCSVTSETQRCIALALQLEGFVPRRPLLAFRSEVDFALCQAVRMQSMHLIRMLAERHGAHHPQRIYKDYLMYGEDFEDDDPMYDKYDNAMLIAIAEVGDASIARYLWNRFGYDEDGDIITRDLLVSPHVLDDPAMMELMLNMGYCFGMTDDEGMYKAAYKHHRYTPVLAVARRYPDAAKRPVNLPAMAYGIFAALTVGDLEAAEEIRNVNPTELIGAYKAHLEDAV